MKRFLVCLLAVAMLIPCGICESEYDVAAAVEMLKNCWRDEVYGMMTGLEGYLEIKNTRIILIADEPKAEDEAVQPQVDEFFGDVDYIVEFILYSDPTGSAPYYQDAGVWDCVVVRKDGSMAVPVSDPFMEYRSRSYSLDTSGIIADVIDLNQDFNAVYRLTEE